jgi:hypothetical protein
MTESSGIRLLAIHSRVSFTRSVSFDVWFQRAVKTAMQWRQIDACVFQDSLALTRSPRSYQGGFGQKCCAGATTAIPCSLVANGGFKRSDCCDGIAEFKLRQTLE